MGHKLQSLRAWPRWLSMLSDTKQVRFDGELYSGQLTGEVHYVDAGANTVAM